MEVLIMSLIRCPECNKEISDKAINCPNCGYPLKKMNHDNSFCNIDGKIYNLYDALQLSLNGKYKESFINISNITKLSIKNCLNILEQIKILDEIPSTYNSKEYTKDEEKQAASIIFSMKDKKPVNNSNVSCPKCGSTAITAGQRGYSFLTGFIGSSKTVNRCANCGYKWKP